jgi:hypothetical protein
VQCGVDADCKFLGVLVMCGDGVETHLDALPSHHPRVVACGLHIVHASLAKPYGAPSAAACVLPSFGGDHRATVVHVPYAWLQCWPRSKPFAPRMPPGFTRSCLGGLCSLVWAGSPSPLRVSTHCSASWPDGSIRLGLEPTVTS